eukprot:739092-Rhodomonas_salina.2
MSEKRRRQNQAWNAAWSAACETQRYASEPECDSRSKLTTARPGGHVAWGWEERARSDRARRADPDCKKHLSS